MKSLLIAVTILGFCINGAAQQGLMIETMDVMGNRRLTDEELLRHIQTHPGQTYDEKQIQSDLDILRKIDALDPDRTKAFTEPGIRGGTHVIFEVVERPLVSEVRVKAPPCISEETVLDYLKKHHSPLKVDAPHSALKLSIASSITTEYLKTVGILNPRVQFTVDEMSSNTAIVTIVINHGSNCNEDPK